MKTLNIKTLLISASAALGCFGAFGQGGALTLYNNTDQLFYFTTDISRMAPPDGAAMFKNPATGNSISVLGSTVSPDGAVAALAGSPIFTVYLYGGPSLSTLTLQTISTPNTWANEEPGRITGVKATFDSMPAGSPEWFQVVVASSDLVSLFGLSDPVSEVGPGINAGFYAGFTPLFTATPQPAPGRDFPLYQQDSPVDSTWPGGSFVPTDIADAGWGDPLWTGGIEVSYNPVTIMPEPGIFALAGLGLAALLIFRRRS